MIDTAIFIVILGVTSFLVFKFMKVIWKVMVWGIAIGLAYVLLKMYVLGGF